MPDVVDYVIVGAGSSGCVLANRLSARADVSVLVVEAGPSDSAAALHIPAAFSRLFRSPLDWSYDTVPQPQLADRSIYWPRGKVLGGSSSVNAMMWVRGYAADYDRWAQLADAGWDYEHVTRYFRRIDDALHIEVQRSPRPLTEQFLEAVDELGLPRAEVNSPQPDGFAQTLVNQRRGRRFSASDGYLKPVRRRRNLTVLTGAHATRVLFDRAGDRPRARGIEYTKNGISRTVRVTREVILAGGAVNSPQLLMLSGVGDGGELRAHGIEVVADRAEVGKNLLDHLVSGLIVEVAAGSLLSADRPIQIIDYLLRRRGMLTSNIAEAYGFVRSESRLALPDLELLFAPVAYVGQGLEKPPRHGITLGVLLEQPLSRGTIALASPDPMAAPIIDPRYLSDPDGADRRAMLAGLRLADRILHARVFRGVVGDYIAPQGGASLPEEERYVAALQHYAHTMYHPVGTCRMGADAASVVDPQLRVRGVEGLRVADASVMPAIIRGHTHAPSLVIGERAAELILE
ncbi:MAG: GMC family oxidoreductase N-terminal domain-containing protein [Terrimesophilobacter sp.]